MATLLPPSSVRLRRLRTVARIHARVTSATLLGYAVLGFLWGPGFSVSEFRDVWKTLADDVFVSAIVPPPPSAPTVSVEAACPSATLSVLIDWADDAGATSFDIYRGGMLLVSGLPQSAYSDVSILPSTSYTYEVVAYGPMGSGSAVSAPVSITTPENCAALLSPIISIVTIGGTPVGSLSAFSFSSGSPTVSGTSNMPNASLTLSLLGATSTYAFLATNANGYWTWTPSAPIPPGTFTLTVTVTHPLFPLQFGSDSMILNVSSSSDGDDDDDGGSGGKKKKRVPGSSGFPSPSVPGTLPEAPPSDAPLSPVSPGGTDSSLPLRLSVDVENPGNSVFQSRPLDVVVMVDRIAPLLWGLSGEVSYTIFDMRGDKRSELFRPVTIREGGSWREALPISGSWEPGSYRIVVRLLAGDVDVSAEAPFRVVALPLFDLGGGIIITRNDVMRFLGWVSLGAVLSLLLLGLLVLREYWLFLGRRRYVTEYDFLGRGFFRVRRGKEVRDI